jgi:hypothetical protein
LEIARIVRNSIIYLLHFVYLEEIKKKLKIQKTTVPILAQAIPDKMKNTRKKPLNSKRAKNRRMPEI